MQQARADQIEQRKNDGQLLTREEADDAGDPRQGWNDGDEDNAEIELIVIVGKTEGRWDEDNNFMLWREEEKGNTSHTQDEFFFFFFFHKWPWNGYFITKEIP